MMEFTTDIVIGLEVHVELDTKTKLFSPAPRTGSLEPNTRVHPIDLGLPGTRPFLNKKAVDYAIKIALSLNSTLAPQIIFSRKCYFYPDMGKNYQITQFEEPLGSGGFVPIQDGQVQLTRIHLEEDPASTTYPMKMHNSPYSFLDYNRAGNPLCEIVTDPCITSPKQAREFLNSLISILSYLKVFDPQTCIIKADANISLRESGYTRVEIKNISGFKELEKALTYEITRQRALLRRGLKIEHETRGWTGLSTKSQRTKETEADYGYIIEPDLPEIDVTKELVDVLSQEIPELAYQKAKRFESQYSIDSSDAFVLSLELELAELFEKVAKEISPLLAAKWLRRELMRVLNYNKKTVSDISFDETQLIELLALVETKQISDTTAQRIMEKLMEETFSPKEYVTKNNLLQMTSGDEIRNVVMEVLSEQAQAVTEYKAGKEKSYHFLLGQVMRKTRGRADPNVANRVLKEELE